MQGSPLSGYTSRTCNAGDVASEDRGEKEKERPIQATGDCRRREYVMARAAGDLAWGRKASSGLGNWRAGWNPARELVFSSSGLGRKR